jgi:hopanoid biosynthesis associated protein HpnK
LAALQYTGGLRRKLIINADDFGLTTGVNRAIAAAHAGGVVTSATLMANSAAFDDAVAVARKNPALGVGCHVVLVDGEPVSSPAEVPSLCKSDAQIFRESITNLGGAALAGRLDATQLEREIAAQIEKCRAAGVALTHLDCHKHSHIFPHIAKPLMRAAKAAGVSAIRNPIEPTWAITAGSAFSYPFWVRVIPVHLLASFEKSFRRAAVKSGVATTDGTVGITVTGMLDQKIFSRLLQRMPAGTWEFVCHPGYNDDALKSVKTKLRESRETELAVLTSEESRRLIERFGIELITYRELAEPATARATSAPHK